jgi:hypothetical protein
MFRNKPLSLVIRHSRSCIRPPERRRTLKCNRLRLDPNDGSPVVDYRIENGRVERRTLVPAAERSTAIEVQWQSLTLEQLTSQVLANRVVAYWLSRRLASRTFSSLGS